MPSATETALDACPAMKASAMLSEGSGKARQAAELSQSVKAVRAPGEQLMNIALMADVKNEPVLFCVEYALQLRASAPQRQDSTPDARRSG